MLEAGAVSSTAALPPSNRAIIRLQAERPNYQAFFTKMSPTESVPPSARTDALNV